MEDEQRIAYKRLVCSICKNRDHCEKTQIKITTFQEKTKMRCMDYEYVNR